MSGSRQRERPWVTVDVVVIGLPGGQPHVLLVRRKKPPFEGQWALPGGFVEPHEPLQQAARRELQEETGAELVELEQLYAFGDPGRDPRGWTISVAYLATLGEHDLGQIHLAAGSDAGGVGWFDLEDLPSLAFDHANILARAVRHLVEKGDLLEL